MKQVKRVEETQDIGDFIQIELSNGQTIYISDTEHTGIEIECGYGYGTKIEVNDDGRRVTVKYVSTEEW